VLVSNGGSPYSQLTWVEPTGLAISYNDQIYGTWSFTAPGGITSLSVPIQVARVGSIVTINVQAFHVNINASYAGPAYVWNFGGTLPAWAFPSSFSPFTTLNMPCPWVFSNGSMVGFIDGYLGINSSGQVRIGLLNSSWAYDSGLLQNCTFSWCV
jgi:hypothetical protein